MSESRFVICPKCGGIVEKEKSKCPYCQQSLLNITTTHSKPIQEKTLASLEKNNSSENIKKKKEFDTEKAYEIGDREDYINKAYWFGWLSLGLSYIVIFPILALYYAYKAKKLGGKGTRLTLAVTFAIVGPIIFIIALVLGRTFIF